MKKVICLLLISLILVSLLGITAYAADADGFDCAPVVSLRAGGGSSGGGGGGGGSSGSSSSSHHSNSNRQQTPLQTLLQFVLFLFLFFSSSIVFYIKLTQRARKSKKLMRQMMQGDNAWKYKEISADVTDGYMAIQEAWAHMDMTPAAKYMSAELFDKFQTQLNWTKYKNQKHVMENIQLIKALPISVHDDKDDSRDYVWFYIKGRMVDYTIDTTTQLIVQGSSSPSSFVEYWQFVRKDGRWVLNKILQENEADQIPFNE